VKPYKHSYVKYKAVIVMIYLIFSKVGFCAGDDNSFVFGITRSYKIDNRNIEAGRFFFTLADFDKCKGAKITSLSTKISFTVPSQNIICAKVKTKIIIDDSIVQNYTSYQSTLILFTSQNVESLTLKHIIIKLEQ
jgi:hypothetical protein